MKRIFCLPFVLILSITHLVAQRSDSDISKRSIKGATDNENVMSDAYWKLWNPKVQAKIDRDIDLYRKADAVVTLKGVPKGTKVKVEQLTHNFIFGANIFNFNQLGTPERNRKYKNLFGTLFNSASIAFYWKKFETQPDRLRFREEYWDTEEFWNNVKDSKSEPHWRRPATDPVVEFCEKKGIRLHGHNMIWGNRKWHYPEWLFEQLCPDSEKKVINDLGGIEAFNKLPLTQMETLAPEFSKILKQQFEKRIIEIANYYGGRLQSWDVVNESAIDYHGEIVTGNAYCKSAYGVMPGDYVYDAFKTANQYLPKSVKININDYANNMNYANQTKDLLTHGCRIDIMGSQMHLFNPQQCLDIADGKPIKTPQEIWDQMKIMSKAGLPIHLSEITITAPGDDKRGRAIQAVIARNLYRLWFSIKPMMGITWWNIVDDCGAPGEPTTSGLFTRNMEPKPSFFALNKLINKEWKTNLNVEMGNDGIIKFRGFKGSYLVSWKNASGELQQVKFDLKNDGDGIKL